MKLLLPTICFLFFSHAGSGQTNFADWEAESKTNKRLLPLYGHLPKTPGEIKSDSDFIKQIMEMPQFKDRREASNNLVGLGFRYYYRPDLKTAMYRFNQAWLLDSTNTDIYWGFGAVYMALGRYDLAKEQYALGLLKDSSNTHLLTDLATYFMEQYYLMAQMPENNVVKNPKAQAGIFMDSAISFLNRSYALNPKDVNTVYKLSVCYWNTDNCQKAWTFYDEAIALGGRPVTEEYTKDLKKKCKR